MLMSYKKKNMSSLKPAAYQISIVFLSHPLFFNSTPIFGNIKAINLNEMSARTLINLQSPLWEQSVLFGECCCPCACLPKERARQTICSSSFSFSPLRLCHSYISTTNTFLSKAAIHLFVTYTIK